MKTFTAVVESIAALDAARAEVVLRCPPDTRLAPGQFLLAHAGGLIPRPIFPRRSTPTGLTFECDAAAAEDWRPGSPLAMLGPLGRPARWPDPARNLLLLHLSPGPLRLLPLAEQILARPGGAVALLFSSPDASLAGLPESLEIRRGSPEAHLPDTLAWADVACLDAPPAALPGLRRTLQETLGRVRPFVGPSSVGGLPVLALLAPPLPCGVGACGVCAVSTRRGWRNACTDGPLFEISDLRFQI